MGRFVAHLAQRLRGCCFFLTIKAHGVCLSLLFLPSPGFWLAKCTVLVLFVSLRVVGNSQTNCVNVLYNHDFQADKFCFMPSCSFRLGVMDVYFIQTGIFKNPLSR